MPRNKDEAAAIRVYTVCDESRYLIVRNVPSLGCGDDLPALFGSYGEIEECKPMDAEDCEPFTDVYWIKFLRVSNARFAKRKLDKTVFLGNQLQVSYAPSFESLADTKEKLECRRKEVLGRIHSRKSKESGAPYQESIFEPLVIETPSHIDCASEQRESKQMEYAKSKHAYQNMVPSTLTGPSNKDYFPFPSMNKTVHLIRQKLDKIQSSSNHLDADPLAKKARVDNRRRI